VLQVLQVCWAPRPVEFLRPLYARLPRRVEPAPQGWRWKTCRSRVRLLPGTLPRLVPCRRQHLRVAVGCLEESTVDCLESTVDCSTSASPPQPLPAQHQRVAAGRAREEGGMQVVSLGTVAHAPVLVDGLARMRSGEGLRVGGRLWSVLAGGVTCGVWSQVLMLLRGRQHCLLENGGKLRGRHRGRGCGAVPPVPDVQAMMGWLGWGGWEQGASIGSGRRQKFSKVSALVYILCKATVRSSFDH